MPPEDTLGAGSSPTDSATPDAAALPDQGEPTAGTDAATHPDASETDATTAATSDSPDDEADRDEDEDTEGATDEERQQKASRSERRKAREQERIAAAVAAEVERISREQAIKAHQAETDAKAKAAAETWTKEFGAFVGTPETRAELQREIDDLYAESIRSDFYEADLDALNKVRDQLKVKQADLSKLDVNRTTYEQADRYQFEMTKAQFAQAGASLPPEHQQRYFQATTVPEALSVLEQGIVAREAAKANALVEAAESKWRGMYEKEVAAHAATRTGAAGDGPVPAGNGRSSSNGLTLERYRSMSTEERLDLTPAQRDEMVARHLAAQRR